MPIVIQAGETTAARRYVFFQCVSPTDGTAVTTEVGRQPQISVNGAAWTNTGIGVLAAIGNGRYYAELTAGAVAAPGIVLSRYKSNSTTETVGTTVQVVGYDPDAAAGGALGSGQHNVLLTVVDDSGNPVQGARVTVGGLRPQASDANGYFASEWSLDAGTYTLSVQVNTAYTYTNPGTLTVDSSGNVTVPTGGVIVVTAFAAPTPASADECVVYGWIEDNGGNPVQQTDAAIFRMVTKPWYPAEIGIEQTDLSADSDAKGYWYISLIRSSVAAQQDGSPGWYSLKIDALGIDWTVLVPDESSVAYDSLLTPAGVAPQSPVEKWG